MSTKSLLRLSRHTVKQLQFIAPGLLITYAFDVHGKLCAIVDHRAGWARTDARAVLARDGRVDSLPLPLRPPRPVDQRAPARLPLLAPIRRTLQGHPTSIVTGWSSLSFTLARWSGLGFMEGIIGASGVYALAFGLLGLLPAPRVRRR